MNDAFTTSAIIKNIGYIPALFVGLSMENYTILAILLVVDVITGVWRSYIVQGGRSITSFKAINGLLSKFLFLLVPMTVAIMGRGLELDLVWLAQMALGLLMLATGYSIIANIYGIRTGKETREFDVIKIILVQIEGILERFESSNKTHGKK